MEIKVMAEVMIFKSEAFMRITSPSKVATSISILRDAAVDAKRRRAICTPNKDASLPCEERPES